jgi:hypothetical protein
MVASSSLRLFYALDQVHAEPKFEVQAEQAQVKAITNLALNQDKPRYINQCSFFILNI